MLWVLAMITNSRPTVPVLCTLDQALLYLLDRTIIVSLVTKVIMIIICSTLMILYGTVNNAPQKTAAALRQFFRHFITKQQGNIEVRICHDQAPSDEETVIEELQLFVQ